MTDTMEDNVSFTGIWIYKLSDMSVPAVLFGNNFVN